MRNKETVLPENFKADEPKYGTYSDGTSALFLTGQTAKINLRRGNDIDGWRYELEYKNGEKRYPPTFLVEERTEQQWNEQEVIPYEPKTWNKE
jgi:hypothetical protein